MKKPKMIKHKMDNLESPLDEKIRMLMAKNQRKFELGDFVGSFVTSSLIFSLQLNPEKGQIVIENLV